EPGRAHLGPPHGGGLWARAGGGQGQRLPGHRGGAGCAWRTRGAGRRPQGGTGGRWGGSRLEAGPPARTWAYSQARRGIALSWNGAEGWGTVFAGAADHRRPEAPPAAGAAGVAGGGGFGRTAVGRAGPAGRGARRVPARRAGRGGVVLGARPLVARVRPAAAPVADAISGRIVAIDAGHGGPDPGAIGVSGAREKDITLAIAIKLEQLLRRAAVYTLMTRTGDHDLVQGEHAAHRQREDLQRRAALVNRSGAHVFVSLHANSFPSPVWSGAQ